MRVNLRVNLKRLIHWPSFGNGQFITCYGGVKHHISGAKIDKLSVIRKIL